MSNQQDRKPDENQQAGDQRPPDSYGPRPTDPIELANWIVEPTADDYESLNKHPWASAHTDTQTDRF